MAHIEGMGGLLSGFATWPRLAALLILLLAMPTHAADLVFPDRDWEVATPESQGLDPQRLTAAIEWFKAHSGRHGVSEMVIVRNGRMVWHGDNIDKRHGVWSCTKSFTSTVLGLLIEDGKCTLDTKAKDFIPELAEKYPEMTLRHLATMTSGYRAIGDEPKGTYTHGPSDTPFKPGEPLFAPGSKYTYWDSAMNLFALVLTRIAGEPLDALFKRRIADPIGMNPKAWDWGDYATIDGLVVNGGSGNSEKHIFISAREMARMGHLFLNRGNWNGKQLISEKWITEATRVHVPDTLPLGHPESGIDGPGIYGLNWWVNGIKADGKHLWPGVPDSTFAAVGYNNNRLLVIPDWNMVIVRLGLDQKDGAVASEVWGEFLKRVGEARVSSAQAPARKTVVAIDGQSFRINGELTHKGRGFRGMRIEGLLMNSRMVQGIFDDLNTDTRSKWRYPDGQEFDAERNTREFIEAMPTWRDHGLLSFTINLQGGSPYGYSREQSWHNSAFTDEGQLRPAYMTRLERILDKADELGMAPIVGFFYFGQAPRFKDETAVIRATENATDWLLSKGYTNVLIEIANECDHKGYPPIIMPNRADELIKLVQDQSKGKVNNPAGRFYVSTSLLGGHIPNEAIVRASDFLLLHGNGVAQPDRIREMVKRARDVKGYRDQPILFNEDDHFDFDKPDNNMLAAVGQYASWGYFDFRMKGEGFNEGFQSMPADWTISSQRKQGFFSLLKDMTGPQQ